ncbi:MAG: GNAT family N-acetyltransferase [Lactobacillus sp.]|nr:GNAT family N-acetyltransferase [Lactobacillus sp.]
MATQQAKNDPDRYVILEFTGTARAIFKDIFLLGDEDVHMVATYIHTGRLFVVYDKTQYIAMGLVLVAPTAQSDTAEIKNIAVLKAHQHQGIGSRLIEHVVAEMTPETRYLLVGTGDADVQNILFYLKNGFRFDSIRPRFFDQYSKPIMANGVLLRDMVVLKRQL